MVRKSLMYEMGTNNPDGDSNVKHWIEDSMAGISENEIREKLIKDPYSLCISYICRYSKLSEDFIEELSRLTTTTSCSPAVENDGRTPKKVKERDKLDWFYLCTYQKYSEYFIRNHQDDVDWKAIKHNQHHLSAKFLEEFNERFIVADLGSAFGRDRDKNLDY